MSKTIWTVAEAKANLNAVIDNAQSGGPQLITRDGHIAAILVSFDEWERRTKRSANLVEFFAESPLPGSDLVVERPSDIPRFVDL